MNTVVADGALMLENPYYTSKMNITASGCWMLRKILLFWNIQAILIQTVIRETFICLFFPVSFLMRVYISENLSRINRSFSFFNIWFLFHADLLLLDDVFWIDVCPRNGNLLALGDSCMTLKIFDKRQSEIVSTSEIHSCRTLILINKYI